MQEIYFFEETAEIPDFDSEFFRFWVTQVDRHENIQIGALNFIFCTNSHIRDMNIKFLNHDYDTDVLTFNYSADNFISGDVFINVDYIRYYADEYKLAFFDELSRIIIHGVLHLLGYDDQTHQDKQLMTAREDFYLSLQKRST